MQEQVADSHGAGGFVQLAVLAHHHHVLEFRDVAIDLVVEPEGAFLKQHHRRNRRDRLGHRIDAVDRVLVDGARTAHFGRALK